VRPGGDRPVVVSPVPRAVWESVLRSDRGAVVGQSLAWRDAVFASNRYEDVSLLYEFPSGRQVVLPMARPRGLPSRVATAGSWPRIWGVGGPISSGGQVTPTEAAAVLADVADLVGRQALASQITLRWGADKAWLSEARRFRVEERGCYVLDLEGGFGHVWQHRFRGDARTAVRKAERSGVDVELDRTGRLLSVFYDLYQDSIRRMAAARGEPLWLTRLRMSRVCPTSPRQLALVAEHFGRDCVTWVARSQGQPVAAVITLRAGSCAKGWRLAVIKEAATPLRASELLHRLDIEDACRDGYRSYDMGGSSAGSSIAAFKEKFGAVLHCTHELHAERLLVHTAQRYSKSVARKMSGFRDI
jgi:GNAT acetyltransferase-like protein